MSNSKDYTVYVRHNVPKESAEELLTELMTQAGPVASVTVKEGLAFVEFEDEESVVYACDLLDGTLMCGEPLEVRPRAGGKWEGKEGRVSWGRGAPERRDLVSDARNSRGMHQGGIRTNMEAQYAVPKMRSAPFRGGGQISDERGSIRGGMIVDFEGNHFRSVQSNQVPHNVRMIDARSARPDPTMRHVYPQIDNVNFHRVNQNVISNQVYNHDQVRPHPGSFLIGQHDSRMDPSLINSKWRGVQVNVDDDPFYDNQYSDPHHPHNLWQQHPVQPQRNAPVSYRHVSNFRPRPY